jgi:hypothetical protein
MLDYSDKFYDNAGQNIKAEMEAFMGRFRDYDNGMRTNASERF